MVLPSDGGGSANSIGYDLDTAADRIGKLSRTYDSFVDPDSLHDHHGSSVGPGKLFIEDVSTVAGLLAKRTHDIRSTIKSAEKALRDTVDDLVKRDQLAADQANAILAKLDGPAPTGNSGGPKKKF